jgi:hypothetical protein
MFKELGRWYQTRDGDPRALALYLRHYSYRTKRNRTVRGNRTFVGPGQSIVLLTTSCDALFVWRHQVIDRLDHQIGVECCIFRNEGQELSSSLIRVFGFDG